MFVVNEAEAAAIRAAYERGGELAAAAELVRLFPGLDNAMKARASARTIAGWPPAAEPAAGCERPGRRRGRGG